MDKPVKLELGHRAEIRKKPTPAGMTHDWCVFVRGPEGRNIHSFIDKIVFHLHESFPKSKRVVKEPPYELHECGYGSFELPIDIYFKNNEEPKKITFAYELFLQLPEQPSIYNVRCEKLTFQNPTPDFKKRLLKAGGELLRPHQPSDHSGEDGSSSDDDDKLSVSSSSSSSAPSSPPHQPMAQVNSAKPLPLPSAKNSTTRAVPMAAVKPLQQQQASPREMAGRPNQPTAVESQPFTELFGTPVKLDSVKKAKISGASKESSSKHSSKESGKHAKKRSPDSHDDTVAKKRKSSTSHEQDDRQSDKKKSDNKSKEKSSSRKEDSHRKSHKSSRHGHSSGSSHSSGSKGLSSEKPVLPSFADEVCTVSDDDSWSESLPSGKEAKTTPKSPTSHAPKLVMKKSPSSQSRSSHSSTHSSDTKKASPLSDGKTASKKSPSPCSPKHASKLPSSDHCGAKRKEKLEKDCHDDNQNSSKSSLKKTLSSVMAELSSDDDDKPANLVVKSSKEKKHRKQSSKSHKVSEKHQRQHEQRHLKEKTSLGKSSKDGGHVDKTPSPEKSDRAVVKMSESVTDDSCEERRKSESKKCAKAPNGALVSDLLEIQTLLMQLQNRDKLRKVAGIIVETGHYSVDGSTFDFDLCNLSNATILKMKSFLK